MTVITICYGLCLGFRTVGSDYYLTKAKAKSTSRANIVLWICGPWCSVNVRTDVLHISQRRPKAPPLLLNKLVVFDS